MLTYNEILDIAYKYIKEVEEDSQLDVIMVTEATLDKPYGSIFFYTSKKYYETKDDKYSVAGNAPFLVEKKTGKIIIFGTARPKKYYIEEYEAGRWPLK